MSCAALKKPKHPWRNQSKTSRWCYFLCSTATIQCGHFFLQEGRSFEETTDTLMTKNTGLTQKTWTTFAVPHTCGLAWFQCRFQIIFWQSRLSKDNSSPRPKYSKDLYTQPCPQYGPVQKSPVRETPPVPSTIKTCSHCYTRPLCDRPLCDRHITLKFSLLCNVYLRAGSAQTILPAVTLRQAAEQTCCRLTPDQPVLALAA